MKIKDLMEILEDFPSDSKLFISSHPNKDEHMIEIYPPDVNDNDRALDVIHVDKEGKVII